MPQLFATPSRVFFRLGKLSELGGVWKRLRSGMGGGERGTVSLSERDGLRFATLAHTRPASEASVDPKRICRVKFTEEPESFLRIIGPDWEETYDTLSAASAVAWLQQLHARREELEKRRAAGGNPRRP